MRLILLGSPGSGKGTQSRFLVERFSKEKYPISQISTGDILRKALKEKSPLGRQAGSYMERGELVPDELIISLIRERLGEKDSQSGFILDGFPRTVEQARALDETLKEIGSSIDFAINLEVGPGELIKRLSGRRVCSSCGAIYHSENHLPKISETCDRCGGCLIQREDDKEGTVKNRLKVYQEQTSPLVKYYRGKGLLRPVKGDGGVRKVFIRIWEILKVGK
jgi:adenylate kinase